MKRIFNGRCIHQCFEVMYLTLHHTGCLSFKLENGVRLYYTQWSTVYGYIVRFILLTSFSGGLFMKITNEDMYNAMVGRLSPVVKFILCFECIVSAETYILVTFSLDKTRKKHLRQAHRLQKIDDELIKDFPSVKWNYNKSSRKYNTMTAVIYTYFMFISFGFVFNLAHCSCGWISSFFIAISYTSITGSVAVASFLFVGCMDMIRLRFRLLRKLYKLSFITRSTNLRSDTKDLRKLKQLEYYFKEYSSMIQSLNEIFGNVSGAGMFSDFAILTNMGFLLCSKAIEANARWHEYVFIFFFIAPRIYKIVISNVYGHMADTEKRNCAQEFVRMENYFSKPFMVRDNLQSFLHWRMHNNYHFTVGKALPCNLSLLFMVFNSITNYIIILIQLQFQQNIIARNLQHDLSKDVELI